MDIVKAWSAIRHKRGLRFRQVLHQRLSGGIDQPWRAVSSSGDAEHIAQGGASLGSIHYRMLLAKSMTGIKVLGTSPALLNLKQCCADVRAFEIRILASSIEKQFVLDAFMQI
jgi:hypothetical protein